MPVYEELICISKVYMSKYVSEVLLSLRVQPLMLNDISKAKTCLAWLYKLVTFIECEKTNTLRELSLLINNSIYNGVIVSIFSDATKLIA